MKVFFGVGFIALAVTLTASISKAQQPAMQKGMQGMQNMPGMTMSPDDKQKEAEIQSAIAKLKPEDRKLAAAQKFCAIQTKNRLGSMGTPVKVMIKDKPVFLCCKNCLAEAQANPDKTLATLADLLKEADIQAALANLKPDDQKLAEAQKFCAIQTKNRLGSMGTPVKVMIKDKPVFLCCKNCLEKAQANPDKTLAAVADLLKTNKKAEPKTPAATKS